ncbi:uncharacterized protein LOC34618129 [Cyclospora cayetanensis]|uniref:U6 snRNA-associated Sm-like protein LSm4 n=1 Tax=Cyclospora cayetanensis TaxID=88456 RepID=A0A6P6S2P6_9EIME|nr:uncharacterized protein LOC34618129 [Cyclospora cayetanensis]
MQRGPPYADIYMRNPSTISPGKCQYASAPLKNVQFGPSARLFELRSHRHGGVVQYVGSGSTVGDHQMSSREAVPLFDGLDVKAGRPCLHAARLPQQDSSQTLAAACSVWLGAAQLPLALLRAAQNRPLMVELKNGETYSGMLAACDGFMNLHLKNSVCTSKDGERFWKVSECFLRGNTVKYARLQEELVTLVKEEKPQARDKPPARGRGRGRGISMRGELTC